MRQASTIDREWLAPELVTLETDEVFDQARERVTAVRRTRYRDLVLEETPGRISDEARAAEILATAARENPERVLALDDPEVEAFLGRVRWLGQWMPDLDLPAFDAGECSDLVAGLCTGRRSFAEIRRVPLLALLRGLLTHDQNLALDRHAPARLEVPSGSHIRLRYEPGKPPVLAARIQELFGLADTPRLAAGSASVIVHLLAPNGRPQQITDDLASFWDTAYSEVRKDLRARYPRHSWPEDPRNANPERRPQRRRR